MNIGLVNEYFPPFAPGGAEWSSLALAQGLANDHYVRVITPNYGAADTELMGGAHVDRFPSPIKLRGEQITVNMRWLANPAFYYRVMRAILKAAAIEPFHILHVQAKYSLPGAYWAACRLGIPIVYTVRDSLIVCPTGQCLMEHDPVHARCGQLLFWWRTCRPLYMARYMKHTPHPWRINLALLWQQAHVRLLWAALKRVDGVIGVSEGILQVYRQAGLSLGRQTAVIYNLPPTHKTPTQDKLLAVKQKLNVSDAPLVLYAGKFSLGKGTQVLVKAADIVTQSHPDVQFLFAGHGELELNGPHTRNLGRLPHDELLALYQLAHIVVIPSVWQEPLSRVGLEAMMAGKPLVGTQVGGTPEQIQEGITGCLVPRKNPTALAEAVENILSDDEKRQEMGRAARHLAQTKFSPETSLQRMNHFYETVIADFKKRGPR